MGLGMHRKENNVFLLKEPGFRTVLINKVATSPVGYINEIE